MPDVVIVMLPPVVVEVVLNPGVSPVNAIELEFADVTVNVRFVMPRQASVISLVNAITGF
jgi:hypothetical protein